MSIILGRHTYHGKDVVCSGNKANVIIGNFCSLANNITFDCGHHHDTKTISMFPFLNILIIGNQNCGTTCKGDIIIGNDVWICEDVFILSGLKIGDGAVIARGSVVTHNVPPYAFVAGNPAVIKRYRFSEEDIKKLLEIKWWNWEDQKIRKYANLLTSYDLDSLYKECL